MDQKTMDRCRSLIENREILEKTLKWDEEMLYLAGAGIFTAMDQKADPERLRQAEALLRKKTGVFSDMRGEAETPILCNASMQADPDAFLTRCVNASNELRKAFGSSSYVPLAALMMVQRIGDEQFAETASQARKIYDLMKAKHFFLTGDDDSPSCVALALSGKDPEALINDSEQCYEILKQNHFSRNAIQSLSNTLAGYDGTPAEKCARAVELSQLLRKNGFDGDPSQFLSGIGVLAMTAKDPAALAAEMMEIDGWMKTQKGFGFFHDISQEQRVMMAGMLAEMGRTDPGNARDQAVQGAVSMAVEEEIILSSIWIWAAIQM